MGNVAVSGYFVGSVYNNDAFTQVIREDSCYFSQHRSFAYARTPQQEEALAAVTRGIINKIAHGPISELRKQSARPDGIQTIDLIRRVFRLDEN